MTPQKAVPICAMLLVLACSTAKAGLTFNPAPSALSHALNLVNNGSFELGAPVLGSPVVWAQGPTGGPAVIPFWNVSGTLSTYATWGGSGVSGQGIRGSAAFPDGVSGLYFGNLFTDVSQPPNFLPSGRVTFPAPPVFTPSFGAPVVLSQTINTPSTPAASYELTFWTSGEDAASAGVWSPGIMGFRITNVLPGDPMQYLTIPSGLAGPTQRLYGYTFTPLNTSLPVTIEFYNWGHVNSIGGVSSTFTSELVLDDVIINAVSPTTTKASSWGRLKALYR